MNNCATILTNASQLLTLRGNSAPRRGAQMSDLGIIRNGSILIEDGKVIAVGPAAEAYADEHTVDVIDCTGKVILPGFIDSHTHPVFTHPRLIDFEKRIAGASYEEIAQAGGGIRSCLRGVRESSVDQLAGHILSALNEMAAHGTTTVEAKSGYGLDLASEIKSLEAIQAAAQSWPGTVVPTLLGAHVVPPEFHENPDEYVRIVCEEMIPAAAQRKLAEYVDVFCERGAFTIGQTVRIMRAAVANGLKTRMHVGQLTHTDLSHFAEFNCASFDHMDQICDDDIAVRIKDHIATLLPAANYFLGLSTFPPARKFIDSDVAVALATDYNPGTSPTISMPFVLSVACTHMKMSPAEAITAATINGACALKLQQRKGSLEPGKDADIAIFDAQDYREIPYWFGMNRCWKTLLSGRERQAADD
jgi:imidazolonepropionase